MRERAAWILALASTLAFLGHDWLSLRHESKLQRVFYERQLTAQSQTIGALRSNLQVAKDVALASERGRRACEEGLGLARLRQHWLDENLGISERLAAEGE